MGQGPWARCHGPRAMGRMAMGLKRHRKATTRPTARALQAMDCRPYEKAPQEPRLLPKQGAPASEATSEAGHFGSVRTVGTIAAMAIPICGHPCHGPWDTGRSPTHGSRPMIRLTMGLERHRKATKRTTAGAARVKDVAQAMSPRARLATSALGGENPSRLQSP